MIIIMKNQTLLMAFLFALAIGLVLVLLLKPLPTQAAALSFHAPAMQEMLRQLTQT